jgi:hypothetical protein
MVPLLPLKVRVRVPVPALWLTVAVTVADAGSVPSRVTVDGEMVQLPLVGAPEQVRDTLPVRPPSGVTAMVQAPEVPREMVKLELNEAKAAVSEWIPAGKVLVEQWALPGNSEMGIGTAAHRGFYCARP